MVLSTVLRQRPPIARKVFLLLCLFHLIFTLFLHRYLWVRNGKRVTPDQFGVDFKANLLLRCGTSWSPSIFRHGAVAMVREHIPPQHHLSRGQNNAIDTALDHTTAMARRGYGSREGDLPYLGSDAVYEQRAVCADWWDLSGTGPNPPPQPLRLVSKLPVAALAPPFDIGEIQNTISSTISSAFLTFQKTLIQDILPPLIADQISANAHIERPATPEVSPLSRTSKLLPSLTSSLPPSSAPVSSPTIGEDDSWMQEEPIDITEVSSDGFELCNDASGLEEDPPILKRLVRYANRSAPTVLVPSTSDQVVEPLSFGDSEDEFDVYQPVSSPPGWPQPSQGSMLVAKAREGIRLALGDPKAQEKSPEQLEAIVAALECQEDFILVLRTGGGKSMIWHALAKVEPSSGTIIVEPLIALLEEQLQESLNRGIVAAKYTAGSQPPIGVQNLFIQPETGASATFKK